MIAGQYRFHGHNSLRLVFQKGRPGRSRHFAVRSVMNQRRNTPRFAVVVSKKVYKSAVKRNLTRRRVFEIVRHSINPTVACDVVITVFSPEVLLLSHQALSRELQQLLSPSKPVPADTAPEA